MRLRNGQKIKKKDKKNALEDVEHGLNLYNHAALMKSEPESEDKTAISKTRKEANTQTRRAPMLYIVDSWRPACLLPPRSDFCDQLLFTSATETAR
jgi:hypothetical protein